MEEIAKAAAVSTASLYNYFDDKDELYQAVVEHVLDTDEEYLNAAFGRAESAVDELVTIGGRYLQFGLNHPGYFQLVAQPNLFAPLPPTLARRIADRVDSLVRRVAEVIERGMTAGEFKDRLEPDAPGMKLSSYDAAVFLHGAWNGLLALNLRGDRLALDETRLLAIAGIAVNVVRFGMEPRTLVLNVLDGRRVVLGTAKELERAADDISAATDEIPDGASGASLSTLSTNGKLPSDEASQLGSEAAQLQRMLDGKVAKETNEFLKRLATLAREQF